HNHHSTISFKQGISQIESYHVTDYGKPTQSVLSESKHKFIQQKSINFNQNPMLYGSGYYDFESQLHFMGARYYSTDTNQFISQDNYNLLNRYNYATSNPVMNFDPNGHISSDMIFNITSVAGSFIGGVTFGPIGGVLGSEIPLAGKTIFYLAKKNNQLAVKSSLDMAASTVTTLAATDIFNVSNRIKLASSIMGYSAVGAAEGLKKDSNNKIQSSALYAISGGISGILYYHSGQAMKKRLNITKDIISYKNIPQSKFQVVNNISATKWLIQNIKMSFVRTSIRTLVRHSLNSLSDQGTAYFQSNSQLMKIDLRKQITEMALTSAWGVLSGGLNGIGSRYSIKSGNYRDGGILFSWRNSCDSADLFRASGASAQITGRSISPVVLGIFNDLSF
ncbi:RHS repeat-associated core domain-containing protein, partial [Francisellaceae bacterium]|nr:RHS repeat-associated core domain-containing protein [Francisellaceae bacterium]